MKQQLNHDYIIIGAGSGGLVVASGLQKLGKDVLVISKNIGGDCTHFGCIPSKNLLRWSANPGALKTSGLDVFTHVRNLVAKIEQEDA
jgi:pyruvate/2-oxoglutarate dehydrogenase complex dihydrolipoamide dehydrogenase (E3) component